MITRTTLDFLARLKRNNNRDWFLEHKAEYENAKKEFEDFISALIPALARFDKGVSHLKAKDCIFRIYRDVRFSKDKSPYKTHFGAHITPAESRSQIHTRAGYYVHIEPGGNSMLAGGAYMPEPPWLNAIRQEIQYNAGEFRKVLKAKEFRRYFGNMEGEKLSRPPKGIDPDHPQIELLKHKSFLGVHKLTDKQVLDKKFLSHTLKVFRALYPFDRFLNRSTD